MQTTKRGMCAEPDSPVITITRHAVDRHLLRSRRAARRDQVARRLQTEVQAAVDAQNLRHVKGSTFLASIEDGSREPLWAVLDVGGPAEKPYRVVVCTVLTSAMVTRSFHASQRFEYAAA